MNTIYRIVWSKVLNTWVVASELAKGKQKTASGRSLSIAQHSVSRLARYFKIHFLAAAILSSFTAIPAYAIDSAECAASTSCVSVSTFSELKTALTTGDKTTILFLNDIKLTGNIDVTLTENIKQNIVIDGGGHKLETGTYSFNFNNLKNDTWENESTFTVSNLSGLVSSTSGSNYIFKTDTNTSTKINIILDNIGSVTDSMIAVLGTMGSGLTQNTSSELTFGNITSPIDLTFGVNHQLAQANKINFTGKLVIDASSGAYPAVFWSNALPEESIITLTRDADLSIKTPNLTSGAGKSNKFYQYNMADGAKFALESDQNIFGSENNGLVLGSYDPVSGFGTGVAVSIKKYNGGNFTTGDGVSNSGGISAGYYNGPAGNKDVVFNLADSSLINISSATSNGILATKTGAGNSSNIYLASGGQLITGIGINAAHAGSGDIVLENKTGGKITAGTGIKAIHTGTGSVSLANHGDISSTANGISVSSASQQTVNINNTGGTISATSGNAVESLLKAQINMIGGIISNSGDATAFKLNDGAHQLTDITVNLNGTGNMLSKTAAAQVALTGVTLNVLNGTGLSDISGLTFKAGQNGNNTINVNGTGTGISLANTALSGLNSDALDINVKGAGKGILTTGGGVDLNNSKLTVNVTSPGGTALSISDGSSNITTIGQNIQLNAAGATALSFSGTAARTLINNGTIGGDVKFAGDAAQTITNNGTLSGSLTTGNGNDVLTLSAGSKSTGVINLGNGDNQVNIDNGADIHAITTGNGNDVFTLNNLTQGSSYLGNIDSGSGNNTLNFNQSSDTLKAETTLSGFSNINLTDSDITLAADTNISGGTVLLDNNSQLQFGHTFNGILNASLGHLAAGDGNAVVGNNAAVTLSKASTFTGNWLIAQGGTLNAGNSNQLGGSSLTVDGTLNLNGVSELNNALTGSGRLTVDGGGNNFTFGTLTGNAYTGHVQLKNALFSLSGQNTQSLAHASLINSSGTTITAGNGEQTVGNLDLNGGKTQFTGNGKIATGTLNVSSNGIIQVDPVLNTAGNLLDADTGTNSLLISSNNTLTAEELARLSLQDLSGNALQDNVTSAVVQNGETVADGIYNYALSGTGTGLSLSSQLDSLNLLAGKVLTLSTQGAVNSDKALTAQLSGTGTLAIEAGAETLTINNSGNNYTGNTVVRTGTLALGSDNALGQTASLNVSADAAADLAGHTQTTGALENAGQVTLGNGGVLNSGAMTNSGTVDITDGTLTLSAGGTSSATGGLTGNGTLRVTGGDLSVSAANSGLAGTMQIGRNASVTLRDSGTLGTAAADVAGTLNLLADNLTLVNALSGDGQVSTQAAVTLSGDNRSFTGEHHLNSNGKLTVSQVQNLGADSATIHLDAAGAGLVLSKLSGSIHQALYGVSGTTVSVTGGSNADMTADNSGFLGNWQVSGDSLLRVAAENNLGKDSSVNLAAAGDTLQLAGYQGVFANKVSGSGQLSLTGSAAVTLDSTQQLGADLAVGIADNSALTLSDLAGFDHALTGSGTLNISRQNAADTFDFGSKTGTAFAGNVSLKNTGFVLDNLNTAALTNATLILSEGNITTVSDGVQKIGALTMDGGSLAFNNITDHSGEFRSGGTIEAGTIDVTGGGEIRVKLPGSVTPGLEGMSLLELDEGSVIVSLAAGQAKGSGSELTLTDENGQPLSQDVYADVSNTGSAVTSAKGTFNYGLTTGEKYDGLYINYGLKALELLATGDDALKLEATTAKNGTQSNGLSALVSGSGDLVFAAVDDDAVASLSNGKNSYTGATIVRKGHLRADADGALGQTSELVLADGTSADMNQTRQTIGALNTAEDSALLLNDGHLTIQNGGTVAGQLSGKGELTLNGGELTLAQANASLNAAVNITAAAQANLNSVNGLGTGDIRNDGKLVLSNTQGNFTNNLSGQTGQVDLVNNSAVQLSGDNRQYNGRFSTAAGSSLTASHADHLGNSHVQNDGVLHLNTDTAWTFTNRVSGSGDIIKEGKGTLQLTDSHVSAGDTLVENGLLQFGGDKPVTSVTVGDMEGYRNPVVTVTDNVVSMTSNVSVSSQGAIGGYGRVNGNVSNAGRIIMPHALTGTGFADFTINGNYSGKDGSMLIFDTVLAGDNAATDRLMITGNADGSSKVTIRNIGGRGGDTAEGIKIIDIAGQSGANFELEGRVVAGAYEYHLYQGSTSAPGDGNWYLRTENPDRPEAGSYTANLAAANTMFVSSMADRSGETLYTDIMTGEKKSTSMWLRTAGSHNRSRDNSGMLKTQDNRFVTQFGGDVVRWSGNGSDLWRTGLMAGYARSHNSSVTSGSNARSKGSSDGYNIGLYGTWFADSQTRTGAYADSWVQYSWFRNEVNGEGLNTEKYDSKGFTASLEGGYILKAGESQQHQFWVQPKAQVVWMGVKADDHTEASNTRISGNGDGNIQTRLGVKAFMTASPQEGAENDQLFKPYGELTWVHNSKDFGTTLSHETTGSYTVKQGGASNIAEVKLGMEGNASPQLNMWGNVTQQIGDNGYSDTAVMVGVKYNF